MPSPEVPHYQEAQVKPSIMDEIMYMITDAKGLVRAGSKPSDGLKWYCERNDLDLTTILDGKTQLTLCVGVDGEDPNNFHTVVLYDPINGWVMDSFDKTTWDSILDAANIAQEKLSNEIFTLR